MHKAVKRHYQELGKKGAAISHERYSKKQFKEWGKLGGRPRKNRK